MLKSILTVTTPAASFDLTNLLNLLADLNINDASAQDRIFLRNAMSQASAGIAQECNRVFPLQTYQEDFRNDGTVRSWPLPGSPTVLQLSRWPITTVTSVTEDPVVAPTVLVADSDYIADLANGQLTRLSSDTGRPRPWTKTTSVSIVYQAGYATIPYDLQDAVHRQVKARWYARARDPMLKAESMPNVISYQYWVASMGEIGNFTPDVSDIIDKYRVPNIG